MHFRSQDTNGEHFTTSYRHFRSANTPLLALISTSTRWSEPFLSFISIIKEERGWHQSMTVVTTCLMMMGIIHLLTTQDTGSPKVHNRMPWSSLLSPVRVRVRVRALLVQVQVRVRAQVQVQRHQRRILIPDHHTIAECQQLLAHQCQRHAQPNKVDSEE